MKESSDVSLATEQLFPRGSGRETSSGEENNFRQTLGRFGK